MRLAYGLASFCLGGGGHASGGGQTPGRLHASWTARAMDATAAASARPTRDPRALAQMLHAAVVIRAAARRRTSTPAWIQPTSAVRPTAAAPASSDDGAARPSRLDRPMAERSAARPPRIVAAASGACRMRSACRGRGLFYRRPRGDPLVQRRHINGMLLRRAAPARKPAIQHAISVHHAI